MEFPWLVRSGVAISQQLAPVGVRSSTEEDGKDANPERATRLQPEGPQRWQRSLLNEIASFLCQ
jgi:hypothetical protein